MAEFGEVLHRLEELFGRIDQLDEPIRQEVLELLDGIDDLHRMALSRIGEALDQDALERLQEEDPAIAWLVEAYSVGVDERAAADAALDSIRPYIHSHGGMVEVLGAQGGVVRLKLSGACAGCTASTVTLKEGIEKALHEGLPSFLAMEVEEEPAESHAPPGPTLLQIEPAAKP